MALCTHLVGVYAKLRQLDTLLQAYLSVLPTKDSKATTGPLDGVSTALAAHAVLMAADHASALEAALRVCPPGQVCMPARP